MTEHRPAVTVVADDVHVDYRVPSDVGTRAPVGGVAKVRRMLGQARGHGRHTTVSALRGVSMVAREGESIGVVGRNGSGKSTFLRTIAGLTVPTRGRVLADGVPVLLGVSAALMPNLSGRRNVILGGLAMGLSRDEVEARFDEVVELAGIGTAINRPMRTYSSGMSARLSFAIASSARPHVLLIDEALNTGDVEFRDRSQERMDELRAHAGTVFLVSHSLPTIADICTRVLWIDKGQLRVDGPTEKVVGAYRAYFMAARAEREAGRPMPPPPWEAGSPIPLPV
ncbi:MAG: teichoic acid transport system ATP-binding protein [Actinomycetota bacterium]|nr:ABC-type polysaccharide/polyol phosphate transport system, ATPase component [Cryptosporangiaceae bacterium]MDQ1676118.1 teichoic acid transport system ATP-binding protein [Actinomycetota bacterium]